MEERQKKLLKYIVEDYIKEAQPVGSGEIAERHFSDLSSATIRNEMAELEHLGLLYQPYTSAGRVPTDLGYRYYVQFFTDDVKISVKDQKEIDELKLQADRESIKTLAKKLSDLSSGAVMVAFSSGDIYYTGISNLFAQPEFNLSGWICSMSEIIDSLDNILSKLYFTAGEAPEARIGDTNPFGDLASSIIFKASFNRQDLLLGILCPLRMDYRRNLAIMNYLKELIDNLK